MVVEKKTGVVTGQFVLQAKAHTLGPKVSGKRDGSVGLGAWVYSKLHSQEPKEANQASKKAPTIDLGDAVIDKIAESVHADYYSAEEGETREDVTAALEDFHNKLVTLVKRPRGTPFVQVGKFLRATSDETSSAENATPEK